MKQTVFSVVSLANMGRCICEKLVVVYSNTVEVEKAIKEMRNRKATGDDDVPGDVLKLLGEGGLKILTELINTI